MNSASILKARMASVIFITEERGWWAKGRLRRDETIAVELCFDNPRLDDVPMADDIPLVYLSLLGPKQCLFEFQNGFVPVQPADSRIHQDVLMIMMHVTGYRHQPTPIPPKPVDLCDPLPDRPRQLKRRRPKFYRAPVALRK